MRKIKFFWVLSLLAIGAGAWYFTSIEKHPNFTAAPGLKYKTEQPEKKEAISEEQEPKPLRPVLSKNHFSARRLPSYAGEIKKTSHPGLPEGFKLAEDVFAVKASKARNIQEKKIGEARGFAFYFSETNSIGGANVAIDERNEKLYPLSSIVKLRSVTEDLRSHLLSKGFTEHFYHEDLQLLYLQSTHAEVLSLFEELTRLGLKPELEVIRGYHRSK